MYSSFNKTLWFIVIQIWILTKRTVNTTFIVEPKNREVVKGETTVFKCTVTNDVETVYWYYSLGILDGWLSINQNIYGSLEVSKKQRYAVIGDQSRGEYFLQIRNVSADDIGEYKCFYYPQKQTGPNRTPEVSLSMLEPPKQPICNKTQPDTAIPSPKIYMRCSSTGTPTPNIQWYRNGNPIEGNYPRASLNMLTWNITEEDSGAEFSCVVKYPQMAVPPSCKITLIPMIPKVSIEPNIQTLVLNSTGKFVCSSSRMPGPLKYKWYINGEVPSRLMVKDVNYRIKHDGKTLKFLWVVNELHDAEIVCRVTGTTPDNPDKPNVKYGYARAYVIRPTIETLTTFGTMTLSRNNSGLDTGTSGGKYINVRDKNKNSSDFINNSEARGELDENKSSNVTVIGVVLSMFLLLALVAVLVVMLYKRNSQINESGKRISAQFMKCMTVKHSSRNGDSSKDGDVVDNGDLYAKPMKREGSKQYKSENTKNEELENVKPIVLPRLMSKKKEKETETTEDTFADIDLTDGDISGPRDEGFQNHISYEDEIIEIYNEREEAGVGDNKSDSDTSKPGSLLQSIYAKLPREKFSSLMKDIRPKKPARTFAESMSRLRTRIIAKRKNPQEDTDSTEDEDAVVSIEKVTGKNESVGTDDVKNESEGEKIKNDEQNLDTDLAKSEVKTEKCDVEKSEPVLEGENTSKQISGELDVATESDDIPSKLPSEDPTFEKPVLRRNRDSQSSVSKLDAINKRSSHTLDNILSNVKRRSLSRRFSGFENRGSTPDLRMSRKIDKNDIVHFVPLGKSNDMTGNVEVVKNRNSINFENEMSQTLLKSFHTIVPNMSQPQEEHKLNERIIDDDCLYENLEEEKETYVSDCSAYMSDDFSDDEFESDEGKPVERVAPMRIIDDIPVYENSELKQENEPNTKSDSSGIVVMFGSTKQAKPTMRVKPTPTPRSFRKSSNSSEVSEHYKKLSSENRKKCVVEDIAKDIDPTTGESIYDNVDYQ